LAAGIGACKSRNVYGFLSSFPKCWNPSRSWDTAAGAGRANCACHGLGRRMVHSTARAQIPLHSRNNLMSDFVPGLSQLAKASSTKPLWMPGKSPVGSRSPKPFIPTVGTNTMGLPDSITAAAVATGESGFQAQ